MDDNLMLIKQFQMQGGTKGADAAFAEEYRNYQRIQNVYMGLSARYAPAWKRWIPSSSTATSTIPSTTSRAGSKRCPAS